MNRSELTQKTTTGLFRSPPVRVMHTDAAAVRGGKLAATYYPVLFKDPDGIQDGGCCAQSAIEARYFRSVILFIFTSERILDL